MKKYTLLIVLLLCIALSGAGAQEIEVGARYRRGRTVITTKNAHSARFHHSHRGHGVHIGTGGFSVRIRSGDFSLNISRGFVPGRAIRTRVYGPNLFGSIRHFGRCRHGRRKCRVCFVSYLIDGELYPERVFYPFDLDRDEEELGLPRDLDAALRGNAVRHLQQSDRPVVVQPELRPPPGRDFPSNLSPLFGGPGRVGRAFAMGERYFLAGRYEDAAEAFQQAAEDAPENRAGKTALALSHAGAGNYWAASRMLRRTARLERGWERLRIDPADAFGKRRLYDVVCYRAEQALRDDPEDEDLLFVLAYLHYMDGRDEHAGIYIDRAHRVEKLDIGGAELRAAIYRRRG